jgi:hypothetical protein
MSPCMFSLRQLFPSLFLGLPHLNSNLFPYFSFTLSSTRPLIWEPSLFNIGQVHSKNMGEGKVPFSHDGFNERAAQIPYPHSTTGENVAWNFNMGCPAKAAIKGWIKSPGHRKNVSHKSRFFASSSSSSSSFLITLSVVRNVA